MEISKHEYNKTYEKLHQFAEEHLDLPTLNVTSTTSTGEVVEEAVDRRHVFAALELICGAKDLLLISVALQRDLLLQAVSTPEAMTPEIVFGPMTKAVLCLQGRLVAMDTFLDSEAVRGMEAAGVKIGTPPTMLRQFNRNLDVFSKNCVSALLRVWAAVLDVAVAKCKLNIPPWEACFTPVLTTS